MKVMTVVGTRPEIIRLACVVKRFDEAFDHVLVHTGQNYDYELTGVFFEDLGLRRPDHYLNVGTSSLGRVLGDTLIKFEEALRAEEPEAVLILGDTNSSIAGVIAKRMRIPVYHMEAGNRCFDENVPEEINRRLIDHVADFNLVYTEHARRNLLAEGIHPRRILLTGSPMGEVLATFRSQIEASDVLTRLGLHSKSYFLVSAHREENVDNPKRLSKLIDCIKAVENRWHLPVLVSTHPRTRKRLEARGYQPSGDIRFHKPFGFHDYNKLQLGAKCVLSDSGTISEESSLLGFPAITLRESIERPEALDAGAIVMTGLDPATVVEAIELRLDSAHATPASLPAGYEVSDTSERVTRFVLSTARTNSRWWGLHE